MEHSSLQSSLSNLILDIGILFAKLKALSLLLFFILFMMAKIFPSKPSFDIHMNLLKVVRLLMMSLKVMDSWTTLL